MDTVKQRNRAFIVIILLLGVSLLGPMQTQANTTITVDSTTITVADDGQCTLPEAIMAANTDTSSGSTSGECPAGSGSDVIVLASQATYTLSQIDNQTAGPNGLPSITSEVLLEGNRSIIERSEVADPFRIFHIAPGGDLTLKAVMIQHGQIVVDTTDIRYGGAIYNQGILHLSGSTLAFNQVLGGPGADGSLTGAGGGGGGAGGFGGALYNEAGGAATLTNSTISGNKTLGGNGGQGWPSAGGVNGFGGHGAGVGGLGGIPGFPGGHGSFGGGGGGGSATSFVGSPGGAGGFGGGGGGGGAATSKGSGGSGGPAGFAAGAGGSSMAAHGAGGGGGAGLGGGVFNNGGTITLENVTLANNEAVGGAGGSGMAAGANGSASGDGVFNNGGSITIKNTILANDGVAGDCAVNKGSVVSQGYNLIGDTSCSDVFVATGDLTNLDPKLEPLAAKDNVFSHALRPDSPAIDGVGEAGSCGVTVDQHGTARPMNNRCDIGAYEMQVGTLALTAVIEGAPPAFGWNFTLNGEDFVTLAAAGGSHSASAFEGTYSLTVAPQAGYDISSTCTGGVTGPQTITFAVQPNQTTACIFTFIHQPALLTISAVVIGDPPGDDWVLELDGALLGTMAAAGDNQTFSIETGSHTLSQLPRFGYQTQIDCEGDISGNDFVDFAIEAGEQLACVMTNFQTLITPEVNTITIIKQSNPLGAKGFGFASDFGSFTLDDGGGYVATEVISGTYTISEVKDDFPDPYWALLFVECEGGIPAMAFPAVHETDSAFEVDLTLQEGQSLRCTFHNERVNFAGPGNVFIYLPLVMK